MFEKMFAVIIASIMGLNTLMLLMDEQIHIFPYILGIDIRYLITIAMMGFAAVASIVRRFR